MTRIRKTGTILTAILLGYIAFTYLAVLAVDFLNLFDIQGLLLDRNVKVPLLWYLLFAEEGPTEIFQYLSNIASVFVLGILAGAMLVKKSPLTKYFLIFGVAMGLLLLEDTGNLRHMIRSTITHLLGMEEGFRSLLGIGVEVAIYGLFGFLMLFSLYKIRHVVLAFPRVLKFLLVGYAFYALAAMLSASRNFMNWYSNLGEAIIERLNLRAMDAWVVGGDALMDEFGRRLGFFLIDTLFEEALELIGAGLIFIGLLTLLLSLKENGFRHK